MTFLVLGMLLTGVLFVMSALDNRALAAEWQAVFNGGIGKGASATVTGATK